MDTDLRNVTRDLWGLLVLQNQYFLQVIGSLKVLYGLHSSYLQCEWSVISRIDGMYGFGAFFLAKNIDCQLKCNLFFEMLLGTIFSDHRDPCHLCCRWHSMVAGSRRGFFHHCGARPTSAQLVLCPERLRRSEAPPPPPRILTPKAHPLFAQDVPKISCSTALFRPHGK